MVDYAGLGNKISVMLGSVSSSTLLFQESGFKKMLLERHKCGHLNVLFIDHDKARYLEDLQIIESNGLLQTGTMHCYMKLIYCFHGDRFSWQCEHCGAYFYFRVKTMILPLFA